MPTDLSPIASSNKLLFDIDLRPSQGHRFQPTGFPDLGAATYETSGGTSLLVESAQSMANRMEAACWDDSAQSLIPDLQGLSYVRVVDKDGKFLTSSLLEAHRLNSVYIEKANKKAPKDDKGQFHEMLASEIGYADAKPIDRPTFLHAIFKYDVGSLVHGTFLESIGGRLRVARAISAFIEAENVSVAASGGVKNDHVMPGKEDGKTSAEGFGNVPFHRDEYTAKTITLFANIDLAQIRGYGLGDAATRLLILLALFKLRAVADGQLRLRTACDFDVVDPNVRSKGNSYALPSRADLVADLRVAIEGCAPIFAKDRGVTTVTYAG